MPETEVSAGRLIASMFELMRENAVAVIVSVACLSAVGVSSDMYDPEALTSFPVTLAGIIAQFIVIRQALDRRGLVQRSGRVVWAYVGVSILTNIGIIFGILLLVVPGVILAIRWSIAVPILLAEEQGVSESLSESWARTKGHALAILVAYLVPLALLIVSLAAYVTGDPESAEIPLSASILGNLGGNIFMVMSWLLSVAIYAALTHVAEPLEEIFA